MTKDDAYHSLNKGSMICRRETPYQPVYVVDLVHTRYLVVLQSSWSRPEIIMRDEFDTMFTPLNVTPSDASPSAVS